MASPNPNFQYPLVAPSPYSATPSVRGDVAMWLDETDASASSLGSPHPVSQSKPLPVGGTIADSNSAAFQGVVAITPGTVTTPQRSIGFICTVGGTITLTLADASQITLPIQTASGQFQTLPFAVTNIALGTGTTGTFWGLK